MKNSLLRIAEAVIAILAAAGIMMLLARIPPLRELGSQLFALVAGTPKRIMTTQLVLSGLAVSLFVIARILSYFRSDSYLMKQRRKQLKQTEEIERQWKEAMEKIGNLKR
jgi:hypothetical protein